MTLSFHNRNFKQTWRHLNVVKLETCNMSFQVVTVQSQLWLFTNDHVDLWIQVKTRPYICFQLSFPLAEPFLPQIFRNTNQ